MKVVADLHIHSRFSRATSQSMTFLSIALSARTKGLNLVGTGDITHPRWLQEAEEMLQLDEETSLYRLVNHAELEVSFVPTAELATVYRDDGNSRRIHHCLLIPSFEVAHQLVDVIGSFGDLSVDGRPMLALSSPELVERLMQLSKDIEVYPAHAWTPWWSIFGSFSGFDSMEECYQDQVKNIHALETGLSSDPPMNWRLSRLDRYTLLSNSDCHSPYPFRLGREANVFDLRRLSYAEIVDTIRRKDPKRLLYTIETRPEYGKYHWTGHRRCRISMSPKEAVKIGNRCPKCGRMLTKGVEQRVEQLSDREIGYRPPDSPSYRYLMPLHEIIGAALGDLNPLAQRVQRIYDTLIAALGTELTTTLEAPIDLISKVAAKEIASAIEAVRSDNVKVTPGYDGVYGQIEIPVSR